MYYLPFISALSNAVSTILERTVLKKRKIDINDYYVAGFLAAVISMLPFIYFFWKFDIGAFELENISIFILIIVLSFAANIFFFYSIKGEKVTMTEPARVVEPLFVILLAILFSFIFGTSMYDRNPKIIIPALIAAFALLFSHIKRHHLKFDRYFSAALLASFLFALEMVLTIVILEFYSPFSFYFIRCSIISLISIIVFKPKLSKIENKTKLEIFGIGFLWVVYRILVYYGYLHLGVINTTLIIMLSPIFIYILAFKFLKEKPNWKNIVSSFVIVACVVYSLLV